MNQREHYVTLSSTQMLREVSVTMFMTSTVEFLSLFDVFFSGPNGLIVHGHVEWLS